MDFTRTQYRELLIALREEGYQPLTLAQYFEADVLPGRFVILRHDVDRLPRHALRIAIIEVEEDMVGSYYFRAVPKSWNPAVIRAIAALEHEVGYHYESLATCKGNMVEAHNDFEKHLSELRELVPVKTICMHGSPRSPWDSRLMWVGAASYHDLGILGEPYLDVDYSDVFYLTDTGRRWDGFKVSLRDKITKRQEHWRKSGLVFHSTKDIIRALREHRLPRHLMLTTHPQRWDGRPLPWMQELLTQSGKNMVKRVLVARSK